MHPEWKKNPRGFWRIALNPCTMRGILACALVLSLAVCSPGPTSTPEPTPTPAPTASPTPVSVPEPSPADIEACSNGLAVAEPEDNPDLVRDCAILLGAMDILVGQAVLAFEVYDLDWSPDIPITRWKGIDVSGGRVVGIVLHPYLVTEGDVGYTRSLWGNIPPLLGGLSSLREMDLNRNELTGEIPSSLANLANLEHLDLCDNRLEGEVPQLLVDLTFLNELRLCANHLEGVNPE